MNGRVAGSWLEAAETLLNTFFSAATDLPFVEETEITQDALDVTIVTQDMVKKCLSKIKGRKTPGLDGLTGLMLRKLFHAAPEYILTIINKCFSEGTFPRLWKIAKVIILLKSPDKPTTSPRSYRPICLLSGWSKILERLMVERLTEDFINNDTVSPMQFGFSAGKSTQDAWIEVIRSVENSSSKYILGIFIDFVGAFDNLAWGAILHKLNFVKARDMKLWRSYFNDRSVVLEGNSGISAGSYARLSTGLHMWSLHLEPCDERSLALPLQCGGEKCCICGRFANTS